MSQKDAQSQHPVTLGTNSDYSSSQVKSVRVVTALVIAVFSSQSHKLLHKLHNYGTKMSHNQKLNKNQPMCFLVVCSLSRKREL